ncbi:hypothetical protein KUTeg_001199 [Tegillarca granosa]|uniref:Uncharacterized protein n=1 Tax=Tegillarca granosa TaxID=220873 RepID=A0ABQ9FVH8_TEGGR|nr:hypothetical protein KUTeg_001199 [Tegillarca granosa]
MQKIFSNRTFYKHKETCVVESEPIKTRSLKTLEVHKDAEFVVNILNKFRDGRVGSFIRGSKIIQVIGYKHYLARKADSSKINEVKREVMMEMRELSRLFICFQSVSDVSVTFEDMYKREHLTMLEEAFNKLCMSEDGEKHGLKVNLNSIFQRSAKILSGYFSESKLDKQMKELDKFRKAYNSKLPELIDKAKYHTEKNSLKKARLPKNLPIEEDMIKIHKYSKAEIDFTVKNFSISSYSWLRSLVVARLTLYNARRGEEGSRLLLEDWHDAENGTWTPLDNIEEIEDEGERYLLGQFKLAYLTGKGRKSVPLLIPTDVIEAIGVLISNRLAFGIAVSNKFVFATKSSMYHCSGWHAVDSVCEAAGVSVNATKNRHRASTVYSSLDMSDKDRRIFFEHLGHSEKVNKENYQCPPGVNEVRVMGKFLNSLEGDSEFSDGASAVSDGSTSVVSQEEKYVKGKSQQQHLADTCISPTVYCLMQVYIKTIPVLPQSCNTAPSTIWFWSKKYQF